MKYRLLLPDGLHEVGLQILKDCGLFEIECGDGVDFSKLATLLPSCDGVIVHVATGLPRVALETAQGRLRFIGCASVGVDHVDLEAAREFQMTVASAAGANAESVGDLALAFMLSFARRLPECQKSLTAGRWDKKHLEGFALSEKTLVLLGTGNTGQATAKRAKAFGMQVLAYDPRFAPGATVEGVDRFLATKNDALQCADILSIHVPLQKDTLNLVDTLDLHLLKQGTYMINTSRGGIVNEQALQQQLDAGHIAGYATDVYSQEPPQADHWLRLHPNVIATPHIGGATEAARIAVSEKIARACIAYFKS